MVSCSSWAIVTRSQGKRGSRAALAGVAGDRCPRTDQTRNKALFAAALHGMLADEADAGNGP
jgi:hypothetical protein